MKLTLSVQNQICACIRAGAFPEIAAEASGVPTETFREWLELGEKRKGRRPKKNYVLFRAAINQAVAQARLSAEMKAFSEDPLSWLKSGPGKDRQELPGWSRSVAPKITNNNAQLNVLLHPQMQALFAAILQVLAPFPQARLAVAQALAEQETLSLPVYPQSTPTDDPDE